MSGFLLDTNVPSELTRPRPEPRVVRWLNSTDDELLYISVVTPGEIRKGFTLLSSGPRRSQLESWLELELRPWFTDRILSVDERIAERWGVLDAQSQLRGAPLNVADGLIAATDLEHGLTLVTRNDRDFSGGLSKASFWVGGDVSERVMHEPPEDAQGVPAFDLAAYEGRPWEDEEAAQTFDGWDRDDNLFIGLEEPRSWIMECVVSPTFSLFFDSARRLVGAVHRLLSRLDRLVIQQASMSLQQLPFAYFVGWPRDPTTSAD